MMIQNHDKKLTKIGFRLDPDDWDWLEVEWLWAERLGPAAYSIRSIPFYAYGISVDDEVTVTNQSGKLFFRSLLRRGGHSTIRLLLANEISIESPQVSSRLKQLSMLRCSYELARKKWIAIDIPPHADRDTAWKVVSDGESDNSWKAFEGYWYERLGHPN